jgi:hypothetical protein
LDRLQASVLYSSPSSLRKPLEERRNTVGLGFPRVRVKIVFWPTDKRPGEYGERVMRSPLNKLLLSISCLMAVAAAFLLAPRTAAAAEVLVVPEPAILVLLGVGLSALAMKARSRRRT